MCVQQVLALLLSVARRCHADRLSTAVGLRAERFDELRQLWRHGGHRLAARHAAHVPSELQVAHVLLPHSRRISIRALARRAPQRPHERRLMLSSLLVPHCTSPRFVFHPFEKRTQIVITYLLLYLRSSITYIRTDTCFCPHYADFLAFCTYSLDCLAL